MQKLRMAVVATASIFALSAGAEAQLRVATSVPAAYLPPAGLCRLWIDGLAPNRQPAPTNCATARAQLRANSRVIYGSQGTSTRPVDPRYDPRNTDRDRDAWYAVAHPNDGRYDGRYDRATEKQRREMEKARIKRERERERERAKAWKQAQKNHDRNDRDHRNDRDRRDDHDGRDHRNDGWQRGNTANGGQATGRVRTP